MPVTNHLEELLISLRLKIGDFSSTPTYSDEILSEVLLNAIDFLQPRWRNKYYRDSDGIVNRNTAIKFDFSSPPVIQYGDRYAIILQSSILIKSGNRFSNVGNSISWRDEEISYSNLEGSRSRDSSLREDMEELDKLFPRKLAGTRKGTLYGYTDNIYEEGDSA